MNGRYFPGNTEGASTPEGVAGGPLSGSDGVDAMTAVGGATVLPPVGIPEGLGGSNGIGFCNPGVNGFVKAGNPVPLGGNTTATGCTIGFGCDRIAAGFVRFEG